MIHTDDQSVNKTDLRKLMVSVTEKCHLTVYGVSTGFTESGMDLGSGNFRVLEKPSVAMIVGDGISSANAGEIWHLFDTRFNLPVTMITASRFENIDLNRYNVLIVTGSPDTSPTVIEKIRNWNRQGGTIIAYKGGNNWLVRNKLAEIDYVPAAVSKIKEGVYANRSFNTQARQIPGSIFAAKLDLTHPLCYGYTRDILPVFKSGISAAKKNPNIYNNPAVYTTDPLLSGYCTSDNIERM
jgi:hypothetical protein